MGLTTQRSILTVGLLSWLSQKFIVEGAEVNNKASEILSQEIILQFSSV